MTAHQNFENLQAPLPVADFSPIDKAAQDVWAPGQSIDLTLSKSGVTEKRLGADDDKANKTLSELLQNDIFSFANPQNATKVVSDTASLAFEIPNNVARDAVGPWASFDAFRLPNSPLRDKAFGAVDARQGTMTADGTRIDVAAGAPGTVEQVIERQRTNRRGEIIGAPNPYPHSQVVPENVREFKHGLRDLNRSQVNIENALKSLDGNNTDLAIKDIERAMRNSTNGTDSVKDGLKETKGNDAAKSDINDGLKEVGQGQTEMQNAVELLKCGKVCEAKEALQEALYKLNAGGEEIGGGTKQISESQKRHGKEPVEPCDPIEVKKDDPVKHDDRKDDKKQDKPEPKKDDCPAEVPPACPTDFVGPVRPAPAPEPDLRHPVEAHMKEIRDGGRHFGNTYEALNKTLSAVLRGDDKEAIKALGYCVTELAEGIGDLRYGATNNEKGGVAGGNYKAGEQFDNSLNNAEKTQTSMSEAFKYLVAGNEDKAIEYLLASIKTMNSAHKQVGRGYDILK